MNMTLEEITKELYASLLKPGTLYKNQICILEHYDLEEEAERLLNNNKLLRKKITKQGEINRKLGRENKGLKIKIKDLHQGHQETETPFQTAPCKTELAD